MKPVLSFPEHASQNYVEFCAQWECPAPTEAEISNVKAQLFEVLKRLDADPNNYPGIASDESIARLIVNGKAYDAWERQSSTL